VEKHLKVRGLYAVLRQELIARLRENLKSGEGGKCKGASGVDLMKIGKDHEPQVRGILRRRKKKSADSSNGCEVLLRHVQFLPRSNEEAGKGEECWGGLGKRGNVKGVHTSWDTGKLTSGREGQFKR